MKSVPKIAVRNLRLSYGSKAALQGISFDVENNEIFAIIGPAQSGKTSLLRCLNRTIDFVPSARVSGSIRVDGRDVRTIGSSLSRWWRGRSPDQEEGGEVPTGEDANRTQLSNIYELRRAIGMVAPLPVGLPLSVYDNVAFAPRSAGLKNREDLDAIVESCLRQAALWDEVKDRLNSLGTKLSGGQQQRLTIARALSHQPEVLCLDEFSIAIDPVTTMRIEDVLRELRQEITIILVTNLTQQARRLADRTMFLWNGNIVELDRSEVIFSDQPGNRKTYDYVNGIFG
jgi:phosphate transport system ATP-binding protein